MKKRKKKYKAVINRRIFESLWKISFVVFIAFIIVSFGKIQGTNSYLSDKETSAGNTMTAGYWTPELAMSVAPASPDGDGGFYKTTPCVTLSANIHGDTNGITIYYEFSNDGDPISGGTVYAGTCIPIPDGNPTHFQAQAVNNDNPSWVSNIVSEDFKVDTSNHPGDVVINEVMWPGSLGHSSDEWVELRNTTGHNVDISGWGVVNAKHSGDNTIHIPVGKTIVAGGYFLIAHYDKTSSSSALNVDVDYVTSSIALYDSNNGNLTLKDAGGTTIDQAKDGLLWPAGWHGVYFHMSMERNATPGDGLNSGSWHTCVDSHCNDTTYWDSKDGNYGTPGHANLSVNDPTDPNYDPAFMEQQYLDSLGAKETNEPDPAVTDPAAATALADPTVSVADPTAPAVDLSQNPPTDTPPAIDPSAPPSDPTVLPSNPAMPSTDMISSPDISNGTDNSVTDSGTPATTPAPAPTDTKKDDSTVSASAPADSPPASSSSSDKKDDKDNKDNSKDNNSSADSGSTASGSAATN